MQYVIITFSVLIIILSYLIEKNIYNPLTMFFGLYGIIIIFSTLGLYEMNVVSQKTYSIIFLGLFSFLLGFLYFETIKPVFSLGKNHKATQVRFYSIRYGLLNFLYVIIILLLLLRTISVFRLLLQGYDYVTIRANLVSITEQTPLQVIVDNYFISPILNMLLPISAIEFFYGEQKYLSLTFIAVLLDVLSSGGRFIVLYLIIYLIIVYLIRNKGFKISNKIKRRIYMIVAIAIVGIISMSRIRIGDRNIFSHLYAYIAGAIPHLDYRLSEMGNNIDYTYGTFYIRGFLAPIFLITNALGIISYPSVFNMTNEVIAHISEPVFIGIGSFNSFVTLFYYFFIDGGWLGVVIGSQIYGTIFSISYNSLKYNNNKLSMTFYLILLQGALISMVRWQFVNPSYALAFFYLLFIFKRDKQKQS